MARPRKTGPGFETTLDVGKAGLTEALVEELRRQLEERAAVKVRFHKGALAATHRKELARAMGDRAGAALVEVRGRTAIYRKLGKK